MDELVSSSDGRRDLLIYLKQNVRLMEKITMMALRCHDSIYRDRDCSTSIANDHRGFGTREYDRERDRKLD